MTEATRVHSTPPLNSSSFPKDRDPPDAHGESVHALSPQPAIGEPESQTLTGDSAKPAGGLSRRLMLAGLAAVGIPTSARLAATERDPIFALIEAKRAADIAHGNAIDAQDEADTRYGHDSEEAWAADEACEAACHLVNAIDWKLARTPPTTLAGIAAVLRFANRIEDEGMEWPSTDTIGSEGWHYQLRSTIAQTIEAIMQAVRS